MNGKETDENGTKKKRITIVTILIVVLIIILAIVSLCIIRIVTSSADTKEQYVSLDVEKDGVNEFSIATYASSNSNKQKFEISKTDGNGNPLQGVSFAVVGYFETSYTIEYYKDSKIASDYTETIYGSILEERYFSTDKNGEISFTLLYGDYGIVEFDTLYGYNLDDTIYWIRVNESGISFISESDVSWDYSLDGTFSVDATAIKNTINSISGYELDYIVLNSKTLGSSIDKLPTSVSDGDVLKIYLKEPEDYCYMYFFEYPYGKFSSLDVIGDLVYTYKKSDTFDVDGSTCLYIDLYYIDEILLESGFEDYVCYIYDSSTFDLSFSFDCEGTTYELDPSIVDGADVYLVEYADIAWMVGDTNVNDIIVNKEYITEDDDLYIFIIDDYGVEEPTYSYNALVYEYPSGKISSAEQVKTYSFDYKQSDIVNVDGTDCIKIDYKSIDSKLKSYGATGLTCFVYGADYYDGSSYDCSGAYESGLLDGNDETLINNAYATWTVGSYSKAIINNEYVTAGDDVYVFIINESYYYTVKFILPDGTVFDDMTYIDYPSESVKDNNMNYVKIDFDKIWKTLDNNFDNLLEYNSKTYGYNEKNLDNICIYICNDEDTVYNEIDIALRDYDGGLYNSDGEYNLYTGIVISWIVGSLVYDNDFPVTTSMKYFYYIDSSVEGEEMINQYTLNGSEIYVFVGTGYDI